MNRRYRRTQIKKTGMVNKEHKGFNVQLEGVYVSLIGFANRIIEDGKQPEGSPITDLAKLLLTHFDTVPLELSKVERKLVSNYLKEVIDPILRNHSASPTMMMVCILTYFLTDQEHRYTKTYLRDMCKLASAIKDVIAEDEEQSQLLIKHHRLLYMLVRTQGSMNAMERRNVIVIINESQNIFMKEHDKELLDNTQTLVEEMVSIKKKHNVEMDMRSIVMYAFIMQFLKDEDMIKKIYKDLQTGIQPGYMKLGPDRKKVTEALKATSIKGEVFKNKLAELGFVANAVVNKTGVPEFRNFVATVVNTGIDLIPVEERDEESYDTVIGSSFDVLKKTSFVSDSKLYDDVFASANKDIISNIKDLTEHGLGKLVRKLRKDKMIKKWR